MVINNRLNAAKYNMAFILSGSLFLLALVMFFVDNNQTTKTVSLVMAVVFLVAYTFFHIIKPNYVYYKDDGGKLVLRYFHIHPLMRKKKAIEIPPKTLVRFQIKKSFFGLKKWVVLHQKFKQSVAPYPPVSISALTAKETAQLRKSLASHLVKTKM